MDGKQTYSSFTKWWTSVSATIDDCCFVLLHANVRSLKKHWNEINSLVEPYLDKLDVLVFSETNIKPEEETLFVLGNFEVLSHSRDDRKGGGTMVIINQKLKIKNSKKIKFSSTEALHVELEKNGKLFSVLSLYRAPQGNIGEFIDDINKSLRRIKTMI